MRDEFTWIYPSGILFPYIYAYAIFMDTSFRYREQKLNILRISVNKFSQDQENGCKQITLKLDTLAQTYRKVQTNVYFILYLYASRIPIAGMF